MLMHNFDCLADDVVSNHRHSYFHLDLQLQLVVFSSGYCGIVSVPNVQFPPIPLHLVHFFQLFREPSSVLRNHAGLSHSCGENVLLAFFETRIKRRRSFSHFRCNEIRKLLTKIPVSNSGFFTFKESPSLLASHWQRKSK